MAGTGKVVYWESISSAATFAFIKKDRSGVEHLISGMASGEKVVAITNAESAGFILTFNSGRLAYMNVRDNHGRPAISVQFLRNNLSVSTGGLFGSIRHAFSNLSLRGDVAAVRADRSARVGERNVVALTGKGRLQAWKVHRGGHNEIIGEADVRDEIVSSVKEADPVTEEYPAESFEALDFAYVPKGLEAKYLDLTRLSDAMTSDDATVQHLLLLVSLTLRSKSRYALVEVVLTPRNVQIGMIRPITLYSTPFSPSLQSAHTPRPRLYLPRPALVAFVVFDRATVVASIAIPPESPDSQLQSDSHILPATFEDVVDFREDDLHEIIGSGTEETPAVFTYEDSRLYRPKTKNPAVVLMVRGAGAVRIVTTDVDKFASDEAPKVSAKSKLEQAVFFGVKQDNPLVFNGRKEVKFSSEEMAQAALEVSHEILSSTTPYIATLPASLEDNLRARSKALERLMSYLKDTGADLDRKTRWNLLYNAEKMNVAFHLWKRHEVFTAARPANDKKSLIGLIVEFIHQDEKHNPIATIGEVDRVRHWFVNDVFRLELFVAWAYEVIKTLYKDRLLDDAKVTVMIYEAVQINICTHVAALEFRKNNLGSYGLGFEELRMGILRDGYEDLPEPWTGCQYISNNAKRLVDLSTQWVAKNRSDEKQKGPTQPDPQVVFKIFEDLPLLTDGMLTSVLEYARWAMATPDQKAMAQQFAKVYQEDRVDKPIALAQSGKWDEGASIAEKHESLRALAAILLDHVEELEERLREPGIPTFEAQNLEALRRAKKAKVEASVGTYGQTFAFPVYEFLLKKHGVESVLEFDLDKHGFKTQFLRSKPELARISWINDVQLEKDVGHGADTLVELALSKEQQVWNKKIELSLGKLALLAELEEKDSENVALKVKADEARSDEKLKKVDDELIAIKIQDQLYGQIFPSTYDAVDEAAAINFAMEAHSMNIPRRQKAQHQLFEDGIKRLLRHEALDAMTLIDLLTLVSLKPEAREEIAHPFWLALKVADSCCHSDEKKEAKRLIWRRLYIRDDWAKINDTQLKDDREVVGRLVDTELYGMLADCIRFRKYYRWPNLESVSNLDIEDTRVPFQPYSPQEALGAFNNHLDRRFRDFDTTFRTKLMDAMKHEDKILQQYIGKNQLSKWLRTAIDAARVEVEEALDEATKIGAAATEVVTSESLFAPKAAKPLESSIFRKQ